MQGLNDFEQRREYRKQWWAANKRYGDALVAFVRHEITKECFESERAVQKAEMDRLSPLCKRPRAARTATIDPVLEVEPTEDELFPLEAA